MESLQWMLFPDGDELRLLIDRTRPERNDTKGLWVYYEFTQDQNLRLARPVKRTREWVAEATANGEVRRGSDLPGKTHLIHKGYRSPCRLPRQG